MVQINLPKNSKVIKGIYYKDKTNSKNIRKVKKIPVRLKKSDLRREKKLKNFFNYISFYQYNLLKREFLMKILYKNLKI